MRAKTVGFPVSAEGEAMTKKEAWKRLAEAFRNATAPRNKQLVAIVATWSCVGLCQGINALDDQQMISNEVFSQMLQELAAERGRLGKMPLDYIWSTTTEAGRRDRVAFAERMAEQGEEMTNQAGGV